MARSKTKIIYKGKETDAYVLSDETGCSRGYISSLWLKSKQDEATFERILSEYLTKHNKKCPKCGRKSYAEVICTKCIIDRKNENEKANKYIPTVTADNCNAHKCGRYMKDSCPGIDLLARNPVFRPVLGCCTPVVEATREQVRGRVLSKVR